MACRHLGHNWYDFEVNEEITNWILGCLSEYIDFVQPYDTLHIRAKKTLSGRKIYRAIFSGKYQDKYNFPVCYHLDLNTGKFKGNNMNYCIDNKGTHYSDMFPVYRDRFKFDIDSRYHREYHVLSGYLDTLDIPDALPSRKERRYMEKQNKKRNLSNLGHWRVNYGRKKKKGVLLRDICLKA